MNSGLMSSITMRRTFFRSAADDAAVVVVVVTVVSVVDVASEKGAIDATAHNIASANTSEPRIIEMTKQQHNSTTAFSIG